MNLIQHERETYETIWAMNAYREDFSPGKEFVRMFVEMAKPRSSASILDAGCGGGKGAIALAEQGFDVSMCDLTNAGLDAEAIRFPFVQVPLWEKLTPHVGFKDYAYCCDVLEHIPPQFTMLVVSRLLEVARKGVFLSISLMPDQHGVWVGRPLHLSIQTFPQWRDQLNTIGKVVECRDLLNTGVYFVKGQR
jgi:2-polyprenyl-3-methyl-5-hydroxy-6-metoxy-1,4-benzoquinol methylase